MKYGEESESEGKPFPFSDLSTSSSRPLSLTAQNSLKQSRNYHFYTREQSYVNG